MILTYINHSPTQLMLDSWNQSIFSNIKFRLQDSAMKLVHSERNGEDFDTQLVIGVRESYGRWGWVLLKNGVWGKMCDWVGF